MRRRFASLPRHPAFDSRRLLRGLRRIAIQPPPAFSLSLTHPPSRAGAAQAEDKIVNNTREVCPGVILTGMELAETVHPPPHPTRCRICRIPPPPLPTSRRAGRTRPAVSSLASVTRDLGRCRNPPNPPGKGD